MDEQSIFSMRLKGARIMKGLSMDELCEKMGQRVSKMAISKYEAGKMDPDSGVLISLSEALELPLDYFYRPFTFKYESMKFRKKSSLGAKQLECLKMTIADFVERYVNIEEICSDSACGESFRRIAAKSESDVLDAATRLREEWNLGKSGIVNVIELLEEHGVKIVEIDAPDGFDGVSSFVNDRFPVVVLGKDFLFERKRFTAMHELGHLILDFDDSVSEKEEESLCNLFANEMLLPQSELARILGVDRKSVAVKELRPIQQRFGISCDAIMYKAKGCGVVSSSCYKWYCIKKSKDPSYKSFVNQTVGRTEESSRFESLVYKALAQELITTSKAANLLCSDVETVLREFSKA